MVSLMTRFFGPNRSLADGLRVWKFALFAALAMVSKWRLPELKGGSVVTLLMGVGVLNYLAVVVWPNWYTVAWWNVWNVTILLAARSEDRRMALQTSPES